MTTPEAASPPLSELRDPEASREVRDAYGAALIALVLSIVVIIAFASTPASAAAALAGALQFVALGVTMRVSGAPRRTLVLVLVGAVVVLAAAIMGGLQSSEVGSAITLGGWLILVLTAITGIGKRLSTYRRINMPFVLGLLCIYLLIGMSFGLAYALAGVIHPPALTGPDDRALSSVVYFSFITLTTVGYGDLAPATPAVRAFAVGEAILGQLYLVSVVSLAVGNFGYSRQQRSVKEMDAE